MTTRRAVLRATLAALALPTNCAGAEDRRPFVLATSTPGGGFARYGETLARILNARAGEPWVVARPTQGTAENLALLASASIDAALIQGTAASTLDAALAILFAMYPSPGLLAVPTASPIRRLADVRGRRVVWGVRASGLVTLARQVFAGIDLDIDRDTAALYVDEAARAPRLVMDGDADALWGAGEGWPGFETLAAAPGGARFIGPTADEIARIVARTPSLAPMQIATNSYRGIDRPLSTVGSVNFIVARGDLDLVRAMRFVNALRAAEADLAAALPQGSFTTLAHTLASAPSARLHRAVVDAAR